MHPATAAYLLVAAVVLACILDSFVDAHYVKQYEFKRYPYKKKQKNQERRIKTLRAQCEARGHCNGLAPLDAVACIRSCMSLDCYNQLYAHDPFEEGEIDQRYNSFRGCILAKDPPTRN